ncbi:MAG: nucleotide sugar dehydrogenase [Patescibacteria group bacterium]|nr:nucleotide sugar dehydrogenase [Patescibacteria group bacterium]
MKKYQLCVIGGAGHVGLPLGVAFANGGVKTVLFDLNEVWLKKIESGKFPFKEHNGDKELRAALKKKKLFTSTKPESIAQSETIILITGTPVDKYLNPDLRELFDMLEKYLSYFRGGQTLILRSTVYPGISEQIQKFFNEKGKKVSVAFCPERIAQGHSLRELRELPQIVSAFNNKTLHKVSALFKKISPSIVTTKKPIEAELSKLFSNAWRYIKFAVANQFFMIADQHDLDYHHIHSVMVQDYARNADLPRPGFAAGPCLFKDTMQLAAFNHNNFFLGHSSMLINEGLPNYLVQKLRGQHDLRAKTVGILGMAFKADSDDARDSLSYKLKKILEAQSGKVLLHDVHIEHPSFVGLDELIKSSDIIILAAPHQEYKSINPKKHPKKTFVDIWNFWPQTK